MLLQDVKGFSLRPLCKSFSGRRGVLGALGVNALPGALTGERGAAAEQGKAMFQA
jgi:hypothetical protein